ncbi:MAG: hypothetical protein ABFD08_11905, partial [Syntrophomonas sp.]
MEGLQRDLLNPTLKNKLEVFQMDKDYTFGKGSCLMDAGGARYLDFIAQYGAVPFGYNPDFIWDKVEEVRRKGLPSLTQPPVQHRESPAVIEPFKGNYQTHEDTNGDTFTII